MPVALGTNKDNNTSSFTDPFSTASVSWTAGARGLACVAYGWTGGTFAGTSMALTGGGTTWNILLSRDYTTRRRVSMFLSTTTPTTGALSFNPTSDGTYAESMYSIDELTGFNTTTPNDTPQLGGGTGTSASTADLGTIDSGDLVVFCAGFDNGADSFTVQAGSTEHVKRTGGGTVRSFLVGYSTTDDTPGVQWTTAGNEAGLVGAIFNASGGVTTFSLNRRRQGLRFFKRRF